MSATFRERYEQAAAAHRSLLCVGLDPDPQRLPPGVGSAEYLRAVIEATADLVCCYKPNAAFFEADGEAGIAALRAVIAAVPDGIPVLLDAKRGDVGHTAAFYARAAYEQLGAHAVTLSPYLGEDALAPFLAYRDRHAFVLCRTSNPSAEEVQDLPVGSEGRPLYEHVAALARRWNRHGNVGLVVGATYPEEGRRVRAICPDQLILLPGVGAQEGELDAAVHATIDAAGGGLLVNASRSVIYAREGGSIAQRAAAARVAARALRDAIEAAREAAR